ncbi:MAG: hypothetical protein P1P88_03930 [Bacteroidales bacterium]|nr:hypothetical protein [Bacteroidales bacterium]
MSYIICITPSCTICHEILQKLEDIEVEFKIKNLEIDDDCHVSIIPALFYEDNLIAYGKDIINYFKHKKHLPISVASYED